MPATIAPISSRTNTASAFLSDAPTSPSLNAVSRSLRKASSSGRGSAVVSNVVFMAFPDTPLETSRGTKIRCGDAIALELVVERLARYAERVDGAAHVAGMVAQRVTDELC